MLNMKSLLKFFDIGFLYRLLAAFLMIGLVFLGEIYLFFMIFDIFGIFFTLAVSTAKSLFCAFILFFLFGNILKQVRKFVKIGKYPQKKFELLAGTLVVGILLIFPGIITDVAGIIFMLPVFRRMLGRGFTKSMDGQLHEMYQYLKLEEIQD